MSYKEFLDEIRKLGYTIPDPEELRPVKGKKQQPRHWSDRTAYTSSGLYLYDNYHFRDPWEMKPALVHAWHVGGTRGGSCWDEGESRHEGYTTGEPEPEWDDLIKILDRFCPDISYLRFRGIMAKCGTDTYEQNEYYGNSSTYSIRYLYLRDLYDHMVEKDLFSK